MSEPEGGARRFSDEEVALIIKRAAELQTEQAVPASATMSLSEIEEIAKEAGIDSRLVRRAAQGLDYRQDVNRPSPWTGAPTRLTFERVVEGELGPDAHEGIVNELRRTFGENGMPSVLGRTLAWTTHPTSGRHHSRGRNVDASVISRGGVTTIRIEEELRNVAAPLFAGLVAGGGGGTTGITIGLAMTAFGSAAIAGGLWILVAGGFYALARGIYGGIVNRRERQLRELIGRLADQARESIEAASRSAFGAGSTASPALGRGEFPATGA